MNRIDRVPTQFGALPRLKLGDRVLVEPDNRAGIVVGICYVEIAYDVQCGGERLRNLCPKWVRRAPPILSVVEASVWQWILWGGVAPALSGLVKVPA